MFNFNMKNFSNHLILFQFLIYGILSMKKLIMLSMILDISERFYFILFFNGWPLIQFIICFLFL